MKQTFVPPVVKDAELARALREIYSALNTLMDRVPEAERTPVKQSEGVPGTFRVVTLNGVTYIQAKGPDGWVEVEAAKVTR